MKSNQHKKKQPRSNTTKGKRKSTKGTSVLTRIHRQWLHLMSATRAHRYGELIGFFAGVLLLGLALYMMLAMIHYLFVGARDQSVVLHLTPWQALTNSLPSSPDFEVSKIHNITQVGGAYLSHWLMDGFLGFGSWGLVIFLALLGLRMMKVMRMEGVFKDFTYLVLIGLWVALTTSAVQHLLGWPTFFRWGGFYGKYWLEQLLPLMGWVGVSLVIVISSVIIGGLLRYEYILWLRKTLRLQWVHLPRNQAREEEEEEKEHHAPEEEGIETKSDDRVSEDLTDSPLEAETFPFTIHSNPPFTPSKTIASSSSPIPSPTPEPEEEIDEMTITIAQGDADSQSAFVPTPTDSSRDSYQMPSLDLLRDIDESSQEINRDEINETKGLIVEKLRNFNIGVDPVGATIGPTVTLYEFMLDPGVKISRIRGLEDDIALSVAIEGVRIIAPLPGKGTIGVEVPNRNPRIVGMRALLASQKFSETSHKLPIALGRTITNDVHLFDLAKMPHLLIAGATGQGKSVGLNVLITSLLYSKRPEELKLILIDPKMLEFSIYESLGSHYLTRMPNERKYIITDTSKALPILESLCVEMDNRYDLLTRAKVRNISDYNNLYSKGVLSVAEGYKFLPYLVLIVDEFADLIMTTGRAIEKPIARLAQKARAAGIHLVLATQRPSTDVITGLIKANFPARLAFKVSSQIDSRTILDSTSAKSLVGRGDLLLNDGKEMLRIQCALIDTPETERIVSYIANQPYPEDPYLLPEPPLTEGSNGAGGFATGSGELDDLFEEVARHVVQMQQGSTSNIQRKFNIGYNRAGRIMDQLQEHGIVGPQDGSKPRQVLISDEYSLQQILDTL